MRRREALIGVAMLLGACATPAVYHPQTPELREGYSERRLDDARWRVEFVGGPETSQQMVESYLLYRAAELTLASGYDWFTPSDHTGEEETEIIVQAPARPVESPAWRPVWRHRRRFFWSDWMPAGMQQPPPSDPPRTTTWTITRHAAREDITMGRGAAPPGAFTAREVVSLLAPTIAGTG